MQRAVGWAAAAGRKRGLDLLVTLALAMLVMPAGASAAPLSWSTPQAVDAGHDLYGGVSCPMTTLCVAADDAGNVVTTTEPLGSWSVASVAGSTTLAGISCPTASLCVAVDQTGHVLSSTEPAGGSGA